ncbi:hypothetical protein KC349_g268 [Hortaea werneckii]|nr:hypothetical protein KC349_g268 [Hortaea werneckii]
MLESVDRVENLDTLFADGSTRPSKRKQLAPACNSGPSLAAGHRAGDNNGLRMSENEVHSSWSAVHMGDKIRSLQEKVKILSFDLCNAVLIRLQVNALDLNEGTGRLACNKSCSFMALSDDLDRQKPASLYVVLADRPEDYCAKLNRLIFVTGYTVCKKARCFCSCCANAKSIDCWTPKAFPGINATGCRIDNMELEVRLQSPRFRRGVYTEMSAIAYGAGRRSVGLFQR